MIKYVRIQEKGSPEKLFHSGRVDTGTMGDLQVSFSMNDTTYLVPFFVLEDCLNEWIKNGHPNGNRLGKWLNSWKTSWQEQPVEELTAILEGDIEEFLFCVI